MPWRMRTVNPVLPQEMAVEDGLSYCVWLPAQRPPRGGIVVLHGAGSCKENHHDFARSALAAGFAVLTFDQRGHGDSEGRLDGRVVADVVSMAGLLRERMVQAGAPAPGAVALRGSSMGGYLAIVAAPAINARSVVAICPASATGLVRGLTLGRLGFEADRSALEGFLSTHEEDAAAAELSIPALLLHAEGDEQVPVQHSRELAERLSHPQSRLVVVPGGHHRSVQHDPELGALALRFLEKTLSVGQV